MKIEFTVTDRFPVTPPPKVSYAGTMNYAVLYGDRSAILSMHANCDEAARYAEDWFSRYSRNYTRPIIINTLTGVIVDW